MAAAWNRVSVARKGAVLLTNQDILVDSLWRVPKTVVSGKRTKRVYDEVKRKLAVEVRPTVRWILTLWLWVQKG